MKFKQERYVRFKDTSGEESYSYDQQMVLTKLKPSIISQIGRGLRKVSAGASHNKRVPNNKKKKIVLHPQGSFLLKWNKIFVLISIIAVSLDPLFFYIPVIDKKEKCLDMDHKMKIISCVLRTLIDLFYVLHIIFEFRTGFIAPPSRVFGRGELIEDSFAIAKRYLCSHFIIDILSILPLPQVTILIIIPTRKGPTSLVTKDLLKFVIFTQYIPRFTRMIPLYRQVTRTSGIFTETPWAGAAFNLFIYMLGSHVIGSFWYLFSIDRKDDCWRAACMDNDRDIKYLYCGENRVGDYSFLNTTCTPLQIKTPLDFDFGIFLDALESHVVETKDFPQKLLYCFWWGLRSLRYYSQHWRTWGACFIQVAWRRHCRRKQEKALWEEEKRLIIQDALANTHETSSQSLGAAIHASRFAANILHSLRTNNSHTPKFLPPVIPSLLPMKPVDPDFNVRDPE